MRSVSVALSACSLLLAIGCSPGSGPVDKVPKAVASADKLAGNAPLTVNFTGKAVGGNPPIALHWSFGDGYEADGAAATHTYDTAGHLVATLTATDTDGDMDEDQLYVDVGSAQLAARIVATPQTGKAPLQVQFTSTVTGGAPPYQSAWDFGDGASSSIQNPVHSFAAGGQFDVVLTVTDSLSKTTQATVKITVASNSKPGAVVSASPTSGVAPLTVAFQGSAVGGDLPITYAWDFGDGTTSTKQNPSHAYNKQGSYTATLTVTDATNDTDSRGVVISVTTNSVPTVTASATPTKGIAPLAVSFTGTASGGDQPLSWLWDFGDGGTSTQPSPAYTYQRAGVYTATVTVTDATGDTASAQVNISAGSNQIPTVTAAAKPTSGTAPLTVSFSAPASGGNPPLTFAWDFGDGTSSTVQGPSHTYTTAGTYVATVVVTDSNGDTDSSQVTVTVATNSQPVVTASASPTSGLAPLAVSFFASAQGGNAPITWQWTFGDGSPADTTQNPTHTYQAAGTYNAQVVATDVDGDADTKALTIQVSSNSVPSARAFADVTQGIAPLKVNFSSQVTGGNAPLSYAWTFGDGGSGTGATVSHTFTTAGTYTVIFTVTDANGDTSSDNVLINVASNSVPAVSASASPASGVAPLAVAFTATVSGGNPPLTYAWDFGDTGTASTQNPSHTYATNGVYNATVVVTDVNGDSASASVQVLAQQGLPDLAVSNLQISAQGNQVVFAATISNLGNVDSPSFYIDFYTDRATAPAVGDFGNYLTEQPLAAGATRNVAGSVTVPAGSYSGWTQVDADGAVAESDETNNVAGPVAYTVYGALVINEVLYDTPGTDTGCFIELHGPPSTDLTGYTLVGVNGADGLDYGTIDLTGYSTRSDGFFVVAQDTTVDPTQVDLVDPNANLQNGPDSLQLRFYGSVTDAVGYGDFTAATFAGEGSPAPDPAPTTTDYSSIGRDSMSTDTDDNSVDFTVLDYPTPGTANPVPGDTCAYAIPVSGPVTVSGNTQNAVDNYHAQACGNGTSEPDVVYAVPLLAGQTLDATVTTAGPSFDTVLYLRSSCLTASSEVACNDDGPTGTLLSELVYTAATGGTYYLVLDGYGLPDNDFGTYTMTIDIY